MHAASLALFCVLALLSAHVCVRATPIPAVSASTGMGGIAPGGSVSGAPTLISAFSNNAGDGGDARSGNALASDSSRTGSPGSADVGNTFGLVNIVSGLANSQHTGPGNIL
ncbi:hypothetical protein C8R44DRAFT_868001 [Mycena epipterygia]|nr:hypothetical protein C8R44DRAFT_868001 [Mycena epipterygia]